MRRAGWITLTVSCSLTCLFLGVIIWSFVKPLPNNFDALTFTVVALGLMVGILAVISASFVAFQWSNFETRLKETIIEADKKSLEVTRSVPVMVNKMLDTTLDEFSISFDKRFEQIEQRLKTIEKKINEEN